MLLTPYWAYFTAREEHELARIVLGLLYEMHFGASPDLTESTRTESIRFLSEVFRHKRWGKDIDREGFRLLWDIVSMWNEHHEWRTFTLDAFGNDRAVLVLGPDRQIRSQPAQVAEYEREVREIWLRAYLSYTDARGVFGAFPALSRESMYVERARVTERLDIERQTERKFAVRALADLRAQHPDMPADEFIDEFRARCSYVADDIIADVLGVSMDQFRPEPEPQRELTALERFMTTGDLD